jgi:hypothetical protein
MGVVPVVFGADLKIRFTDKSRLTYNGDWAIISYQAYTSKTVGSGQRKGTVVCRPNLSGTYQIFTEYKSTLNRGKNAKYYVNGSFAKEIDQKGSTGEGQSHFPKVSLGVFALTPESTVELRCQDGRSYSLVAFSFSTSTATPSEPGSPGSPSGDGSSGGDSGVAGDAEKSFTAESDGEMTIQPYLSTYNSAELRVLVDGKEILAWVRTNSTSKEPLVFNGTPDSASMTEAKPGDFSPTSGLKYTYALKAGQKVTVIKKGNFESGTFLKVDGPFSDSASLGELGKSK